MEDHSLTSTMELTGQEVSPIAQVQTTAQLIYVLKVIVILSLR